MSPPSDIRAAWSPATRVLLASAAVLGLTAVAAGAFGAHALSRMLEPRLLETFETAARYQMYHALALLGVGVLHARSAERMLAAAGWCLLGGTLVFSGSLYALVLLGMPRLGAVTPLGGLGLMTGWLLLGVAALRGSRA